jgi:hypothetical protein
MELEELKQRELNRLAQGNLRYGFVQFYSALGGNLENLRRIVQLSVLEFVEKKLAAEDLPGPDSVLDPLVLEWVEEGVGEAFDELFGVGS